MEEHAISSERLEDQLKAMEWARAEQKKILKEKGERLSKELTIGICSIRKGCTSNEKEISPN